MSDHYFTAAPQSEHKPSSFSTEYRGRALTYQTDSGVFSRTELDRGTEVLLDALPDEISGDVLDMGCGYGALGVAMAAVNPNARLVMTDVNERAAGLARDNARANGVQAETLVGDGYAAVAGRTFDWIFTNPPIRAGKQVIYKMFADGAASLNEGGVMILVIRKQQGAPSAITYLKTLFGEVETIEKKSGFWIIRCAQALSRN